MSPQRLILRPGIMNEDAQKHELMLTEVATDFLGAVGGGKLVGDTLIEAKPLAGTSGVDSEQQNLGLADPKTSNQKELLRSPGDEPGGDNPEKGKKPLTGGLRTEQTDTGRLAGETTAGTNKLKNPVDKEVRKVERQNSPRYPTSPSLLEPGKE